MAFHVLVPTMPSWTRPWWNWKFTTAARVCGPKMPSTAIDRDVVAVHETQAVLERDNALSGITLLNLTKEPWPGLVSDLSVDADAADLLESDDGVPRQRPEYPVGLQARADLGVEVVLDGAYALTRVPLDGERPREYR